MGGADTIYALATAQGRAGISVIRVSGPQAVAAVERLSGALPEWRELRLRVLRRPSDGYVLDEALVVRFPKNESFTGEITVEIQGHGSISAQKLVLEALGGDDRLRLADPGEFTRLALLNGRLDLTQVEGLADLIDAETAEQHRQALHVMRGGLARLAGRWRRDLVRAAALIAAVIDFSDEDLPDDLVAEMRGLMGGVVEGINDQLVSADMGERVRSGFEVAIVGAPNVGKSTLLNAIVGREAAITSYIAGTTRDVIEVRLDINGLPVTLMDTAGMRETDDQIETIGVERAVERAVAADLRVFLRDDEEAEPFWAGLVKTQDLVLLAKCDVVPRRGLGVSGKTGEGVQDLLTSIGKTLADRVPTSAVIIRERQAVALKSAKQYLSAGLTHLEAEVVDLAAEELRAALRALDSVVGKVDVEDMLDEIFASFCLGK